MHSILNHAVKRQFPNELSNHEPKAVASQALRSKQLVEGRHVVFVPNPRAEAVTDASVRTLIRLSKNYGHHAGVTT